MRTRTRAWWRIGLTGVAAFLLFVVGVSCWRGMFIYCSQTAYVEYNASIVRGALHVTYADRRPISTRLSRLPEVGWRVRLEATVGSPIVEWAPAWSFGSGGLTPGWFVRVPLWIPILIVVVPAAWMWWRWSHPEPGVCANCRYDLRGSRGEVCPECGSKN